MLDLRERMLDCGDGILGFKTWNAGCWGECWDKGGRMLGWRERMLGLSRVMLEPRGGMLGKGSENAGAGMLDSKGGMLGLRD